MKKVLKKLIAFLIGLAITVPCLPSIKWAVLYRLFTPLGQILAFATLVPDILLAILIIYWAFAIGYIRWG